MGSWLPVLATLAGILVTGAVTFVLNKWNFERDRDERRRIAALQIAAQLRAWLVETMQTFRDHPVFYQPDPNEDPGDPHGYFFPTPSDIPGFPFADSLERISQLSTTQAEAVFGLIEMKADAERQARLSAELEDYEAAAETFEPLIVKVWLQGTNVYECLSGLPCIGRGALTQREFSAMKERAEPKVVAAPAPAPPVDNPEPPAVPTAVPERS